MLCLKKRRTYSFTQGACSEAPRRRHRSASAAKAEAAEQRYNDALATLPRKHTPREERSSAMVLTVTEDTPADMLAGSMELLVQMPRDHHVQTQRVTVQRSTPMMDLLVQIATAHKLAASSYTLQAIGERGLVLPHQPNTPIGALDALQVKLLPKQGTFLPRKSRQTNQPFETTFRLQVHLPRNQLYVSRVSPKTNLGEILEEVCREKNLDRNKYELRHPANLGERLDLGSTLQDYRLQEVSLCPRQLLGSALSSQDIMALQRQEECRRQHARHGVFGFIFKKSKESSLSSDSLGNRSASPARSDETARSASPAPPLHQQLLQRQAQPIHQVAPPARPHRKRRPAPKPPTHQLHQQRLPEQTSVSRSESKGASDKDKMVISHSRNSSDSSGYHEASVLSDNPDCAGGGRMPETLPRRGRAQGALEGPRRLGQTSQASKSLGNLAVAASHGGSCLSLASAGLRKKRAAPAPPLPSAISAQGLERILDSDESLTSDMDLSKPSSDIGGSKASSDLGCPPADAAPARVALARAEHAPVAKPRTASAPRSPGQPAAAADAPATRPRKSSEPSRACPSSSSSGSGAPAQEPLGQSSLPSLTEDEEIALAIDAIALAATGRPDGFDSLRSDEGAEVGPPLEDPRPEPSCAVISTIPKCDHLEPYAEDAFAEEAAVQGKRRPRLARSQSEADRFDPGPGDKLARHLTSNGETIACALNRNLGEAATRRIEASIAGSDKALPTDTDILLQKVSDTLSHSLVPPSTPSPPPTPEMPIIQEPRHEQPEIQPKIVAEVVVEESISAKRQTSVVETLRPSVSLEESNGKEEVKEEEKQRQQQQPEKNPPTEEEEPVTSSEPCESNAQQDTSDYVSANGEDLSIGDWEYQIPAPPSAFRDDNEPAPEPHPGPTKPTAAEAISVEAEVHRAQPAVESTSRPPSQAKQKHQHQHQPKQRRPRQQVPEQSAEVGSSVDAVDACAPPAPPAPRLSSPQRSAEAAELKRAEVISELESKLNGARPAEAQPPRDESYAPRIAPVENNLANFTITTYARPKSLDIFEQLEQQQQQQPQPPPLVPPKLQRPPESRVLGAFATLTRGRSSAADFAEERPVLKPAQSMERVAFLDARTKLGERNESPRDKATVHRSKSYIVLSSNEKFQNRVHENSEKKREDKSEASEAPKKFTSLANVNASANEEIPRHKEKFSQWRDNFLRKQEEPTKEKQLQSLQVLKSILPQLKSAQATEENGYKGTSDTFTPKKRQEPKHEEAVESPVVSSTTNDAQLQAPGRRSVQETAKRYSYSGPPAVSLGSWSERPCVNVQIKTDTDYKFGGKRSASGARTVVNLNGANEAAERNGEVKEPPVKEKPDKVEPEEPRVDTTSVNFRELTKAFGQDVRLRAKPPGRNVQNRFSECLERVKPGVASKQNGFADSHVTTTNFGQNGRGNGPALPFKRYTSIIGITNNLNGTHNQNGNGVHSNGLPSNLKFVNGQATKDVANGQKEAPVPKPPTMPIITGVTLKSVSARPKSNPTTIQADPRDQLLESIRNFGRDKLKSTADRY